MQRLTYLRIGTVRISDNPSLLILRRCLSNKDETPVDSHVKMYKPSTEKKETHITDDLKGGQSKETIDTSVKITPTLTGSGKVWSMQTPGSVHIAPLGAIKTTAVPPMNDLGATAFPGQTIGTDQLKSQPEVTPGQLAEAAAASAFEPFNPNTPISTSTSNVDNMFAPKISSTDVHSSSTSPTAHFQSVALPTTSTGQTTSSFDSKSNQQESATKEIPIQRESDLRDDILRESLRFVDEKGWTLEAIRGGIRATNQPSTVEGLFSNGYDLVEYFMRDANEKMSKFMSEETKKGELQGSRLLIEGLKYRLTLVIPYARTWDQALAQGALPQNAMRGWKTILDLASHAWNGIGDTSADINWYTKRLLVAAIYKSAEIFMLQDQSPDKIETMKFLERRLADFQAIGSVRNSVSKSLSDTAQLAGGLVSVVRNLTSRR